MKIGINASYLTRGQSGVRRYLANLLVQWQYTKPDHEYHVYLRQPLPADVDLKAECIKTHFVFCPRILNRWLIWENVFLAAAVARDSDVDLFFSPSFTPPQSVPLKSRFLLPLAK